MNVCVDISWNLHWIKHYDGLSCSGRAVCNQAAATDIVITDLLWQLLLYRCDRLTQLGACAVFLFLKWSIVVLRSGFGENWRNGDRLVRSYRCVYCHTMESQTFQLRQYMQLYGHIIHVEPVDVVGLEVGTYGNKKENHLCAWHCSMENVWSRVGNQGQLYALFNLSTRCSGVW
jgi:hypothetical protein